jgi:hypothetical protein
LSKPSSVFVPWGFLTHILGIEDLNRKESTRLARHKGFNS